MVLSTKPLTPCERSPSGAPVPVGATPTSIATVLGAVKWTICQRSTRPASPFFHSSCMRQNGGGPASGIQRVALAGSGAGGVSDGASPDGGRAVVAPGPERSGGGGLG